MKLHRILATVLAALPAVLWTATGETSDPVLHERELPLEVVGRCLDTPAGEGSKSCGADSYFATHWVGRAGDANLFLVRLQPCSDAACRAWLVAKSGRTVNVLLATSGELALSPGVGAYPAVQTYSNVTAGQSLVSRFDWNGNNYTRTDARLVYSVDGQECGSAAECNAAAQDAMNTRKVDRALRIWEQVHGVSWI
jgi:hypothetical protein